MPLTLSEPRRRGLKKCVTASPERKLSTSVFGSGGSSKPKRLFHETTLALLSRYVSVVSRYGAEDDWPDSSKTRTASPARIVPDARRVNATSRPPIAQ